MTKTRVHHVFADGGYAGAKLRHALTRIGNWNIEIIKRSDRAKGFTVLPRRWAWCEPLHGSIETGGWPRTSNNPSLLLAAGSSWPPYNSSLGASQEHDIKHNNYASDSDMLNSYSCIIHRARNKAGERRYVIPHGLNMPYNSRNRYDLIFPARLTLCQSH